MKLYGWEKAFQKFVAEVRKKELGSILIIQLLRATDRASSMAFVMIAAFLPIWIIYLNEPQTLNSSMIYATLE